MGNHDCCYWKDNDLKMIQEMHFPHSLGLLYSAFTYYDLKLIVESIRLWV